MSPRTAPNPPSTPAVADARVSAPPSRRPGPLRRAPQQVCREALSGTVTRLVVPRNDSSSATGSATGSAIGPDRATGVQGTLALELREVRSEPSGEPEPSAPTGGAHLSLVPSGGQDPVRAWAGRFGQAVMEVLAGTRPVTQLLRWTSPEVYEDLTRRVAVLSQAGRRARLPQVRSVHVTRPAGDAAEVCLHVAHGRRSRAVAARLEAQEGRWQCTALEFG